MMQTDNSNSVTQYNPQQNYQMNPETYGEPVALRHSHLWRNPMHYQKPVPLTNNCHAQLNQLGMTGQSWRTRNNFVSTISGSFRSKSTLMKKTTSKKLEQIMSPRSRQSHQTRSMIKSLQQDTQIIDRSAKLVEGMQKLREMNLLGNKDLHQVKFPGIIKHQHVYNDYHLQTANPGYSRNYLGKFYTK